MNQICKHWFRPCLNNKFNYRFIQFDNKNKVLKMNEAYFKHLPEEGKIAISFRFVQELGEAKKFDRVFNFVRDLNENVDVSLNRIKSNLEKELTKKMKPKGKRKKPEEGQVEPIPESLQVRLMQVLSIDYEIVETHFRFKLSYTIRMASSLTRLSRTCLSTLKPPTSPCTSTRFHSL